MHFFAADDAKADVLHPVFQEACVALNVGKCMCIKANVCASQGRDAIPFLDRIDGTELHSHGGPSLGLC